MNSTIKDFEFTFYINYLRSLDKSVADRLVAASCDDTL